MNPDEHPTSNIEWQRESSLTSAFDVRCWTFDVFHSAQGFQRANVHFGSFSWQPAYRVPAPLRFFRRPADVRLVPIVFGLGLGTSTSGHPS